MSRIPGTLAQPELALPRQEELAKGMWQNSSRLTEILHRHTRLVVMQATHGARLCCGTAYVAPPDRHLVIGSDRTIALSAAPKVNWTRPAIDVLFQSIATHFRERAIGVVLTGYHRDGALGAQTIKQMGGRMLLNLLLQRQ